MEQELDLWGDPILPREERRGRPTHQPTDEKRNRIKVLRALNKTDAEIAAAMGLSEPTLRKYYLRELKGGFAQLRAEAAVRLWELGRAGNVAALKAFIAETRHADLAAPSAPLPVKPRLGKKDQANSDAAEPDIASSMGALLAERESQRIN